MPFLFQRTTGAVRRVMSPSTVTLRLKRACREIAETHPDFANISITAHDFRRLFATDLVNNGLPIHIGAALLGHLDIQTTRGYVTVFEENGGIVNTCGSACFRRPPFRLADRRLRAVSVG